MANDNRHLQRAFFLCAIGAIAGALLASDRQGVWQWLHYLTKPTATALLFVLVVRNAATTTYGRAIAAGLVFALAGDVFLMLPGDFFLFGLICFLLTHCAYIYALTRDARVGGQWPIFAGFAMVALVMVAGLWNAVPAGMRPPVAVYAAALAFMAAQAMSRASEMPKRTSAGTSAAATARLAAIGGVLFLISDTILAYGRFRWVIPGQSLWVLGTYYIAQWLFARSTYAVDDAETRSEDRVTNRQAV
ncbi:lysoplasmalogenase [Bradyrhizobium guangdongense]|uniref:lysoplasmalogenase n=1 Tax=Bradyrhizobium guangdongense TaxID=1325090 RepID=UPI001FF06F80|nr:lysoplasmalogenase [Bradyrhizobium guangdongense]